MHAFLVCALLYEHLLKVKQNTHVLTADGESGERERERGGGGEEEREREGRGRDRERGGGERESQDLLCQVGQVLRLSVGKEVEPKPVREEQQEVKGHK